MIYIGIPTGNRPAQAEETVKKWSYTDVNIAVSTWDADTYVKLDDYTNFIMRDERRSFAHFQNYMASKTEWDGFICGADDLWPGKNINKLESLVRKHQGKILFVQDGVNSQNPCHPVITREWYDKHGKVFNEDYIHNFCDTDLHETYKDDFVRVFGVTFVHKHWINGSRPKDEIDAIGAAAWDVDRLVFEKRRAEGFPAYE